MSKRAVFEDVPKPNKGEVWPANKVAKFLACDARELRELRKKGRLKIWFEKSARRYSYDANEVWQLRRQMLNPEVRCA